MELLRSFLKAMFVDVPYWQATQSFVGKESIFSGNDAMSRMHAQLWHTRVKKCLI